MLTIGYTKQLLNKIKYSFCIGKALLDPSKHITMNHNPHNMFIDAYDIGQYPQVPDIGSIAAKTYQPLMVNIIASILNRRYSTQFTEQSLYALQDKSWDRILVKVIKTSDGIQTVLPRILNELSSSIIVGQSRWTWIVEQQYRLQYSTKQMSAKLPETLRQFLERYNELIEEMILMSNLGHSIKIPQSKSALQKHYEQQFDHDIKGVKQLNRLKQDKNTLINRFMAFIHRF